jgi:hypothetical protein
MNLDKTRKQSTLYNRILRVALTVFSLFFLAQQLFFKYDFNELLQPFQFIGKSTYLWIYLLLSILLMPLNWLLEAVKWRYLLRNQEHISLRTALSGTLAGATISAVSPNRTGDFLARVFVLRKTNFWRGVFITLIGSYAQTLITLIFGVLALIFSFGNKLIEAQYIGSRELILIYIAYTLALFVGLLLYFRIHTIESFIPKKWRRWHWYAEVLNTYHKGALTWVLAISFFRYTIFSLQFYLAFLAFGVALNPVDGMLMISIIYLFNTLRPSIALFEIGIRGSIAIFVVSFFVQAEGLLEPAVFSASTFIWLINIILPALIGLLSIRKLNFFKT